MQEHFIKVIRESYTSSLPSVYLGAGVYQGEILADAKVSLPLHMMNRHGLVTGATGSAKTRTLQLLAEQLSAAGVPVFIPDMKGDLSGLAKPACPMKSSTSVPLWRCWTARRLTRSIQRQPTGKRFRNTK